MNVVKGDDTASNSLGGWLSIRLCCIKQHSVITGSRHVRLACTKGICCYPKQHTLPKYGLGNPEEHSSTVFHVVLD